MPRKPTSGEIRLFEMLQDEPPLQVGVSLPGPLSVRLDYLVEVVRGVGQRTSRKELIAALLLDAPEDPRALSDLIVKVRTAKSEDAVVEGADPELFLSPRPSGPGPRVAGATPSRAKKPATKRSAKRAPKR